jgi:hypothetical protein
VLPIAEIEAIIGNNLPINASRDNEWWNNNRSSPQGRAWTNVGWSVESVDLNNDTVTFLKVSKPNVKRTRKPKESTKTPFYQQPFRYVRRKKRMPPSKTRMAQALARAKNVERQKLSGQSEKTKIPNRPAHEKRLFKPDVKPSPSD